MKHKQLPTQITTSDLQNISHVKLCLENCEVFTVWQKSIKEICFEGIALKDELYIVSNGKLLLVPDACEIISDFGKSDEDDGICEESKEDYKLFNRLTYCQDIVGVDIAFLDGSSCEIYVEYDPVVSMDGCELEYSNCHSIEKDESGNVILLFGGWSHNPRREDLPWYNYIVNYKNPIPQSKDEFLIAKIADIFYKQDCYGFNSVEVVFSLQNKGYVNKTICLRFDDATDFCYDTLEGYFDGEMQIQRFANGLFRFAISYVLDFTCRSIIMSPYEYELSDDLDNKDYTVDDIFQALRCQVDEQQFLNIARGYNINPELQFRKIDLLRATNKVKTKQISVNYYCHWLKMYVDCTNICFPRTARNEKAKKEVVKLMTQLSMSLRCPQSYAHSIELIDRCVGKIKKLVDKIK